MAMTIAELARAAGVGVETVRFYQRKQMMQRPGGMGRPGAGIRHYGTEDVRRLRFIRAAQRAGFTLKEIARLLDLERESDRTEVRAITAARVEALDKQIAELSRARGALVRLAGECARSEAGPCPILNAFEE